MSQEDRNYIDGKFDALFTLVTPLATAVAIQEERQKEHPTNNKLYAVIGGLVTLVVALMAIVVPIVLVTPK